MKIIKKSSLYIIIVIAANVHHSSWALPELLQRFIDQYNPMGVALVKEGNKLIADHAPVVKEITKIVANGATDVSKVLLHDATKEVANGAIEIAKIAAPAAVEITKEAGSAMVDASAKIGMETAKELAKVGNAAVIVAGVGVGIYSVVELYPIGKEVASNVFPSKQLIAQRAASLEDAEQRLKLLQTRREFRDCLVQHRLHPDRSDSGLPSLCEEAADALAHFGMYEEVEKAAAYLNKHKNRK